MVPSGRRLWRIGRRQQRADRPSSPRLERNVSERTIAITGGDAGYFDLIKDCIGSLRAVPEGRAVALGVLDCGLNEQQRAWCLSQGAILVAAQWDFDFPGRDKLEDGYKALTARP